MIEALTHWQILSIGIGIMIVVISIVVATAIVTKEQITKVNIEKIETIKYSEKRFRSLIESMDDSVVLIDHNLNIHYFNNCFGKVWNIEDDKVLNLKNIINNKAFINELNNIDTSRKNDNQDVKIILNKRTYFFNVSITPQMQIGEDDQRTMIIFRDFTERREMEVKLRDLINVLKEQQSTLKILSSELITAQENERKRISRELHDIIGQRLTAISLNLESIKSEKSDNKNINKRLKDSANMVVKTIKDVQNFSFQLRPAILDDLGLIPAMKEHINAFSERTGIEVKLDEKPGIESLSLDAKTVIYRVFQESLNNISKHSSATSAIISFQVSNDGFIMRIKDDGIGFKKEDTKGLGIISMQERLNSIGGTLSVESNKGKGTSLTTNIPFNIISDNHGN